MTLTLAAAEPIAFVGLGAMGLAMAANLVKHQKRVVGFDVKADAMKRFEAAGGRTAPSIAATAKGAGTLVVMTVNADQAEDVLFANGGLEALAPGATVIVMATCAPARITAMAERVAASGRHFIDAPVSGGVVGAEAGTLLIMAAAPKPVFAHHEATLKILGSNLFHLGERAGQGASMKIVNQLLCGVHIAVAAEGLAFAERQGIDAALALKLLTSGAANSWMLANRGPRMVADDAPVASAVDIFVKDLGLVLDAGKSAKMALPLAALSHQLFLAASGMGLGAKDDSQVIATYRALAP
jgi:3-hydroxyisobutyrate dehydrogenase